MGQWMCEWLVWVRGLEHSYPTMLLHALIIFAEANQRWYREGHTNSSYELTLGSIAIRQ